MPSDRDRAGARTLQAEPRGAAKRATTKRASTNHPTAKLAVAIRREAKRLGAGVVGFAPVGRWSEHGEVPPAYRPDAVWPSARTVIAFGVPLPLPVVESTPSINYQELYDTSNRLLDEISLRLSGWLNARGHPSVFAPRDGYGSLEVLLKNPFASFSHTYAAKYAGLGTVGMSRNLLTREWGPRVRLNSVLTAVELPGDPELEGDLCNGCSVCERLCPASAILARDGEVLGDLDKDACTRHHIVLRDEKRWPCGICVKVCPLGADRRLYRSRNTKRYLDERAAIEKDPADPRYHHLVHLRRHGSGGDRIA
ncbi:MAG TPA: 4Fe-4S dicluster domain-containing protein [Anaeromyxobacteraceae bacterium]|nr:4Fe-4S dicluster domain-containing protein [Anaeromyxobacteraceae bacterium]